MQMLGHLKYICYCNLTQPPQYKKKNNFNKICMAHVPISFKCPLETSMYIVICDMTVVFAGHF